MSVRSVEFSSQTREMPVYNACRSGLASGAPRQRPFVRPFSAQASRCPGQWLPRSLADVICFSPDRGSTVTPLTLRGLCWPRLLTSSIALTNARICRQLIAARCSKRPRNVLCFLGPRILKWQANAPTSKPGRGFAWVCVSLSLCACVPAGVCLCACVLACLRACVPACLPPQTTLNRLAVSLTTHTCLSDTHTSRSRSLSLTRQGILLSPTLFYFKALARCRSFFTP
jgi:hypothetical protein